MATISDVFANGHTTIADMVNAFDFSKIDVKDNSRNDYLREGLAPSFGTLNATSVKTMDDNIKIMISSTMRLLSKIPSSQRTWDKVQETLNQNSLIEPQGEGIARSDKFSKSGTNVFKVDGSPDSSVVREVTSWFTSFVGDEDVLKSTQINISVLGSIVAQTGATIDSFESFFYKNEYHEKNIVDIGVMRFPDPEHPYFKVYNLKLKAWSDCTRYLFVQEDNNGINGSFNCSKYQPRASAIAALAPQIHDQAVEEANGIFN